MQTERQQHSSTIDVQSFREARCDADQCRVVAKVMESHSENLVIVTIPKLSSKPTTHSKDYSPRPVHTQSNPFNKAVYLL
jgi:hypothetical protein